MKIEVELLTRLHALAGTANQESEIAWIHECSILEQWLLPQAGYDNHSV